MGLLSSRINLWGTLSPPGEGIRTTSHLDLYIAFCPAAAGQNFPFTDKG